MSELESLKKKIIYRANYRGTKEMDLLLSKFVDKYLNTLSKDQLYDLFDFLNLEDEIIYSFYFNKMNHEKIKETSIKLLFSKFKL
tara:strand:- start:21 stop:275 length:255 start_codon:yes stop_codon:yes gene_type:complete